MPQDDNRRPISPSTPPLSSDREIEWKKPRGWFSRHRSALVAIVVVVIVLIGGAVAVVATLHHGDVPLAEQSASVDPLPSTAPPTPSPTPSTTAPPPPATSSASGTVEAVNGAQWTVQVEKGLEITVVAGPSTQYVGKGKSARDVKKGVDVQVTGTFAGGVLTATKVAFGAPSKK